MKIQPDVFWEMTMRQFILAQKGYLDALQDDQIHQWNMTRTLCVYVLHPHLRKGKKLTPQDIMHLPIDGKTKSEIDIEKKRKRAEFIAKKYAKIEDANKNKRKKQVKIEELFVNKNKKNLPK
jgi:hypothetical protein